MFGKDKGSTVHFYNDRRALDTITSPKLAPFIDYGRLAFPVDPHLVILHFRRGWIAIAFFNVQCGQ